MLSVVPQFGKLPALLACCCLSVIAVVAQEATPTPASTESEEVIRITTELVQTDVMVFDKQGKFVDGLKADQFDLRVDGKPQAITFFERIKAGAVDEDAQLAAARGGAMRREGDKMGAALPLDRGRTVFFFVDDIHLSPDSLARVRKTLLVFIENEMGQNDEAAIISATGQPGFLQQLTGEKIVLRAAVARLMPRSFAVRDLQSPPMTSAHALAIERLDNSVLDFFIEALQRETPQLTRASAEQAVMQRARSILAQTNYFADGTLISLENVVRGCAPLPGRKLVFFISDGFQLDERNGNAKDRLQRITDAAARSGVVIYSVGAQGLTSGTLDATTQGNFDPSGRLTSTDLSELRNSQEPLSVLAADTGGRALLNTNAFEAAVGKALEETSVYYLLAWKPEGAATNAPKFRRIEASVKGKPDLRVIVRRGFFDSPLPERPAAPPKKNNKKESAPAPRPIPMAEKELFGALTSRHPRVSLPTSLTLGYISTSGQGTVLTVSLGVERELLEQLAVSSKGEARVDIAGAVYNDKGDTLSVFRQELSVSPSPAQSNRHSILYNHTLRLTPGLYQVRVAALELKTRRTGSASEWIEIPSLGKGEFSMSSLFVGERTPTTVVPSMDSLAGESVLISVDRRFNKNSFLRFLTFIYNATGGSNSPPDVALQVQMFRDDQPVFTAPLNKLKTAGVADLSRIPYAAELPLTTFPPGRYVLQITALDRIRKATANRRVKFVVE